ncbi:MAG: NUDIX domain-containing protein [Candidatus Peribacteria bacterium]|nr:MAG: NUDIX domain-containing protein [Candidatus Peribacteria bacterium]
MATGEPTMAVSVVNILLFNESGELIIQKRAKHKNHNAGLLDKTVGGRVQYGDPIDYTVMVETVEELQCPSIVVKEDEDFEKRLSLLKSYVKTLAVVSHIDTQTCRMYKVIGNDTVPIANKFYLFF